MPRYPLHRLPRHSIGGAVRYVYHLFHASPDAGAACHRAQRHLAARDERSHSRSMRRSTTTAGKDGEAGIARRPALTLDALTAGVREGNRAVLARAITLIESTRAADQAKAR